MKIKILLTFCILESVLIFFLLCNPNKSKYSNQFPGEMELNLQKVGEEALSLTTELNGIISDSIVSPASRSILRKYKIGYICRRDSSIYFLMQGGAVGGETGLIYSKNGNPNWDGINSMKRVSGGFYEYSSFY